MPDYDPKSIPVLDDIIEDDGDETAAAHDKIIITEEMQADDNTLDLFNESSANIEMDNAEPEIGAIDQFINEDIDVDIETIAATIAAPENETLDNEAPAADADSFESALIDYPHEDDDEQGIEQQAESDVLPEVIDNDDKQADNEQANDAPDELNTDISETAMIAEPASSLDLDAIIDDVVTQLMPELEQQLRTRLKQALQKSLPQEVSEPEKSNT